MAARNLSLGGQRPYPQTAGVTRNKAIEHASKHRQLNKIRNASKHRGKGNKARRKVLSWAEGGIPVPEKVVEAACPLGLGP